MYRGSYLSPCREGVQDRGAWQAPQPLVTGWVTYPKLVSCSRHQLYALAFKVSGSGYSPDTVSMVDRERWIQRAPGHLQTNLSMWSKVSEAVGYQCLPLTGLPCLCSMCAVGTKHPLSLWHNIWICWDVSEKQQHTYNALWQMLLMSENPFSLAIKMLHLKIGVSRTRIKEVSVLSRNSIPKSAKRNYQVSNSKTVSVKNCFHLENMAVIIILSLLVLCL